MKTDIRALDLVRRIRDTQAGDLAKKTRAEIVAFFRRAGSSALEEALRSMPSRSKNEVG